MHKFNERCVCPVVNRGSKYSTENKHDDAIKMGKKLGIEVVAADSQDVISEADVICTATSSNKPVFENARIRAGVHINGVGSYRSDMAEIPPETIIRAKIVVDRMKASLSEAGDLVQPIEQGLISIDHIHGELGEIVAGVKPARQNEDEITVFKSVGVAVQDLTAANLVLKKAKELGLGTEAIL